MDMRLYGVEHLSVIGEVPAVQKRDLSQFSSMINCATGRSAWDYYNYGNWCGWGGSGNAVDGVDR
jgi:hypothetical protein